MKTTIFLMLAASLTGQSFEVVSIKPVEPDLNGYTVWSKGGPGTDDPGLFRCENNSLLNLVTRAYDIPFYRVTAPDWMQQAKFNVNAKIPAGATKAEFLLMLQNMLAERFKLALHRDKKEMQMYELVVAKGGSKLKASVEAPPKPPDADADKKRAPEPMKLAADGYPAVTGTGMAVMYNKARIVHPKQTMEALAMTLSSQVGRPVADATGLSGKFDITIFWDTGSSRRSSPDGTTPLAGASDPDAGPSLMVAIQEQLGLKLESKKGPVEILVVDHAEKVPTEN
jgi:uncharacterized protein (TIGR03435 family)